jgi:hypothetical protein
MPVVASFLHQFVSRIRNPEIMTTGQKKPHNAAPDSDYRAFLIRCWHEGENWRFTLETIGQERQWRLGFARYEQLSAFLKQQFIKNDGDPGQDHQEGGEKK